MNTLPKKYILIYIYTIPGYKGVEILVFAT